MTRRFLLTIEYEGTGFAGWQVQNNGRSVQEELERALAAVAGHDVRIIGAGRTDAGVHATGQTAHADLSTRLDAPVLLRALAAHLPADVCVHDVREVSPDLHARYAASSRTYQYTVAHEPSALYRRTEWLWRGALDHARMAESAAMLEGMHDFTSFSKASDAVAHCWCHVFSAQWAQHGARSVFTITANRFLYGMVRSLTGALVQVGTGRLTPADIAARLAARDRAHVTPLAPAHGLVLTRVAYDAEERAIVGAELDDLRASGVIPPVRGDHGSEGPADGPSHLARPQDPSDHSD